MAGEGWLADLLGSKLMVNGIALAQRATANLLGAVAGIDNAGAGRLDITIGAANRVISSASGTINDLNTQNANVLEFTSASAKTLTSMIPTSVLVYIVNRGAGTLSLSNNSGGTAANRLTPVIGAQIDLDQGGCALAWYDANTSRWLVVDMSGSGAAVASGLVGGNGFDTTNLLGTAANGGIRGHAGGYWVALMARIDTATNGGYLAAAFTGAATGWRLWQPTATTIAFEPVNGSGAFVVSSQYTFVEGEVNLFVGVHTGSQVRLYAERAQVGSDVAITGATPLLAGERMTLGVRNTGATGNHPGLTIFGACGGDNSVPSLAEIQALSDLCKSTGDIGSIPGKTDRLWSVKQSATPPNFPATLDDEVGSDNMTVYAGAASGIGLVEVATPSWAF